MRCGIIISIVQYCIVTDGLLSNYSEHSLLLSAVYNARRCFDDVVGLGASEVVPVLVVAAAQSRPLANGAAAEVDARHVVDDRADVRELHVLLGDALASAAASRRQLTLLRCSPHPPTTTADEFSLKSTFFGSRPSDHYFRSVCLSVCLFVCLFVQSFSQPSSIRFGSN